MSNDKVKVNRRKLNKTEISLIVIACVLFVLIVLTFSAKSITNTIASSVTSGSGLNSKTVNNVFYMLMPKEVEGVVSYTDPVYDEEGNITNGVPVVFHVEKNKDFDFDNDQGIDYFTIYYYDDNGDRVDTDENGKFESGAYQSKFEVLVGFTFKTVEKLNKIVDAFKIARIVMVVLLVLDLIAIWYVEFSISEDMKKEQYNKNKPKKKK